MIIINDCPEYEKREDVDYLVHSYGNDITYVVNEKKCGANYSRNLGANISKGEYISFLDDDDYWAENRLEKVVALLNGDADIVYSDYYIFNEKRKRYIKRFLPNPDRVIETILSENFLGGFSNVTFKRSCFDIAGQLDEDMPSCQDHDLFIRMLQYGQIAYINEGLCYYRVSANSISLNNKKKLEGFIMLMEKYSELYMLYPDSLKFKLESEYVYALKQNWNENSMKIRALLKQYDSSAMILFLYSKGTIKRILTNVISAKEKK